MRREPKGHDQNQKLLTVASDAMQLREFVRLVAQKAEVSIVVEDDLDERLVSVDVRDQPVSDVLSAVARRLGVQVSRTGDLYFLGELRAEDKGVLVRRVGRLNKEDLLLAVKTLTSENGRVVVDVDGLLVVGDRVEVLRRVEELIDRIQSAEAKAWVVQLYVVGLSRRAIDDLGIDFAPALDVAVTYATAADPAAIFNLNAALSTLLSYEQSSGEVATLAAPTFVVRDGDEARTFVGETIPVPKRSVGVSGNTATVEFVEVEAGLDVFVSVREVGQRQGLLKVEIDRSRIKGFVEESPIITSERFSTTAVVNAKGVYLLGELQRGDFESSTGGSFRLGRREVDQWDVVQVWARTHAIADSVISSPPGEEASPPAMRPKKTFPAQAGSLSRSSSVGASEGMPNLLANSSAESGPTLIDRAAPQGTSLPRVTAARSRSVYEPLQPRSVRSRSR